MLTLFTYRTPQKFADDFKNFYTHANLKQIKILSMIILVITILTRLLSLIYYTEAVKITSYSEHSLANYIQMFGAVVFYISSSWALKQHQLSLQKRKLITLLFILFVLIITFGVSYVVSLHNTKNTLTMFLIGIVTVSLFFAIEYKEIVLIASIIVLVFVLSMVLPKISFQDKMMNFLAGIILGMILISFSRYGYYFKSQHFVRLKQLEEKNLEIERLNSQKSEILAFVAHDLRNPLNNIEMLSGFLLEEKVGNGEVGMIASAAKQAKEIINDLIEAVRIEQPILKSEKIELSNYLKNIVDKWKLNANREINLKSSSELFANLNSSKMERVIDNLITNALKFSKETQPVELSLIKHNDNICIVITDYGIGIPENMQEFIFQQFSKSGRKGLKGEKSIGLGLHISKRIVEQHGGKLLIKSKVDEGTSFTILLPSV
ncbi:MAG: HAMP domain-containing histidine kinase [Pedobacter sp.]|nr:MAG: HAMP domain-containing histidine kinase [Pedobacter sp.]